MLKTFTLGLQHAFKNELSGMCKFMSGQPPVTLYHDKLSEHESCAHKLYMKYDGHYVGVILDDTLHASDGLYEVLFHCDYYDDFQIRTSLGNIAAFISIWQQEQNLAKAAQWLYDYHYGEFEFA